jgi:cell pole-organizing protein PopZ
MSSATGKQDMSMDEILASIRSYVAEGQNLPKSSARPQQLAEETVEKKSYETEVIHLTDEVIPIETVNLQMTSSAISPLTPIEKALTDQANSQPAMNSYQASQNSSSENPFSRLKSEIVASIQAPATPSADDLLNQLASPLIKSWLDQNLRKLVEEIVEKEIEKMRNS